MLNGLIEFVFGCKINESKTEKNKEAMIELEFDFSGNFSKGSALVKLGSVMDTRDKFGYMNVKQRFRKRGAKSILRQHCFSL